MVNTLLHTSTPFRVEIPVKERGGAHGMSCGVNVGGLEAVRVVEGAEVRHVDAVFGDVIIGAGRAVDGIDAERGDEGFGGGEAFALGQEIGRASCRERVCQYV